MTASIIMNAAIIAVNIVCVIGGLVKTKPPSRQFRYFTTLSNLLCAAASAAVILLWAIKGALPMWTVVLKYAGTCAVTVTMMTVLLFLGPASHEWKLLLTKEQLFLHLICPLLAIVSFVFFEKTRMPAAYIAIGALPVVLYGLLYCRKVVFAPEERRWDDFYGFNKDGKWPLSCGAMAAAGALIALILWAV